MKKLIIIIIILVFILLLIPEKEKDRIKDNKKEVRGVFISYIELSKYIKNKDIETIKNNINIIINNIYNLKFNTIYLQVRSFNDSIYKSKIFPWSSSISVEEGINPEIDILDYFIKECRKKNITIYAWINPYRVRTDTNINSISNNNPAYKYINTDYLCINNGIYLNPAKQEIEDLIVEGIEEILKNYDVNGIIFDDYFYPNNYCDNNDYEIYSKNNNISREDYHLMIINKMVKRVKKTVNKYNKEFGISPDGNIDNNYNKNYADIKRWLENNKYVDFIMPQIYYGFYNQNKPFVEVVNEWDNLIKDKNIKLYIALAFYKVGVVDTWALSGSNEWVNNNDIIMKEIILSRNLKHYDGFSLFRYDYLFDKALYSNNTDKELENMKSILN